MVVVDCGAKGAWALLRSTAVGKYFWREVLVLMERNHLKEGSLSNCLCPVEELAIIFPACFEVVQGRAAVVDYSLTQS